jgi:O-antigen ligase
VTGPGRKGPAGTGPTVKGLVGKVLDRAFVLPGMLIILVAIGGRYTLDRAGYVELAWVDLRVIGIAVGVAFLAIDLARRPHLVATTARRPEGWLVVAILFFLFQISSGLWAPAASRVGPSALDIALEAILTIALYFYTLGDPVRVVRWSFILFYLAAVVFALGAAPGDQGRYAAFGGGPNVFVRIEILGIIAAFVWYLYDRRKIVFLGVPLFVLMSVLSGSRAGLLAGVAVGVYALWRVRHRLTAGMVAAGLAVVVIGGVVVWYKAPDNVTGLIQDRFVEQTIEQGYGSGRTDIWVAALRLAWEHPIAGAGLDGFYGAVGHLQNIEYPHQYLLAVLAEGGAIGFGLLLVTGGLWAATVRRNHGHPREVVITVVAATFVAISSLFSGDYYDARLAWLFAAMAAAAAITRTAPDPAPPESVTAGSEDKPVEDTAPPGVELVRLHRAADQPPARPLREGGG